MELGEYFLHLYIQETSGLNITEDKDLIIKVSAFGEQKVSEVIKE